jgi:hypothetical protein
LFGEIRSLEHSEVAHRVGSDLDALAGALDALDADVDPEVRGRLIDRLCTPRIEHVLEEWRWSALGEHVYSYTNHVGHHLVGVYVPDTRTFGVVCPPLPGDSIPRFIECLGTARGLTQIEGMLACIEAEFTPREVVVELDEPTILGELERRRAYIQNLDPERFDLAEAMSDACGQDDYLAWSEQTGRGDANRHAPGGEVRCFAEWEGGARVYDPALSTRGCFDDDCSSIWVARNARFDSAQQARDWARERAGRAPAYYRLSREWRFLCSGKTYNKYAGLY